LKEKYGYEFVPHERLRSLIRLNHLNDFGLLDVGGLTAAYRDGNFSLMRRSLSRQLECIIRIFELEQRGRLLIANTFGPRELLSEDNPPTDRSAEERQPTPRQNLPALPTPQGARGEQVENKGDHRANQLSEAEADDEARWLMVSEAAQTAGCNSGLISRAVSEGKLKSNGKNGRARRIDAVDLTRWIRDRSNKPDPEESDEQVERLVNKHVRPD
jgi:hypothetical protein